MRIDLGWRWVRYVSGSVEMRVRMVSATRCHPKIFELRQDTGSSSLSTSILPLIDVVLMAGAAMRMMVSMMRMMTAMVMLISIGLTMGYPPSRGLFVGRVGSIWYVTKPVIFDVVEMSSNSIQAVAMDRFVAASMRERSRRSRSHAVAVRARLRRRNEL